MLVHDRSSTAGSVSGVIAIIFLVGQQLAILFGLLTFMSILIDNSGADLWVVTANTQDINSAGSLPQRYQERLEGLPGIAWAEPMIISAGLLRLGEGNFQPVQVVGVKAPDLVGGPWRFRSGSSAALLDPEGITLDYLEFPVLGNPEMGDVFELNGRRVRLRAVTMNIRGFGGTLVFTNIENARRITGFEPDRASAILVRVEPDRKPEVMRGVLQDMFPEMEVYLNGEFSRSTRLYYLQNTGIGGSFGFATLIGALVGVVIIALTMYTNILSKQKDFAVLRALGARRRDVLIIVLYQSLFIALMGIVAGFTLLALFLFFTQDSSLPSYLPLWLVSVHVVMTVVLCLAGSLLAIRKAMKIEPASAFR
jgi:putative ABC transport system permease protein